MTDGEPETAVSASLQKIKSINTNIKKRFSSLFFLSIFYVIKSQTSDSFDNHFDGHFAYLKTLDFSFKMTDHACTLSVDKPTPALCGCEPVIFLCVHFPTASAPFS